MIRKNSVFTKGVLMLAKLLNPNRSSVSTAKEGDLYKEVTVGGKTFRLVYGYYEDFEKEYPEAEPMPIYPDFIKDPCYADDKRPIVTAMQDICKHYLGKKDADCCSDCKYFEKSQELFGICSCPQNKKLN